MISKHALHYIRAGKIPLERVLPYIGKHMARWYCGHKVNLSSLRLMLFKNKSEELFCVKCGIKAKYFAVERTWDTEKYHLNLYGNDEHGYDMLITKDHIIPRSKKGPNHLSNLQVMCADCNWKKGSL